MSVFDLESEAGSDRLPPQDIAAEASVLGAMLLSRDAIGDAVEVVKATHFYRPNHATIFQTIVDLYTRDEPADAVTVAAALTRQGELAKIGGAAYLHTLVSGVPTAANADYYARLVRDTAVLRRLVEAGTRIAQLGYNRQGDLEAIVNAAQEQVFEATEQGRSDDFQPISSLVLQAADEITALGQRHDGLIGVPSGLSDLDHLTNGFQPGQLVIVAARPGLGKSTLALDFCRATAIANNLPAAFFSLEMSASEITLRLLSAESGIELTTLRSGRLSKDEWAKLTRHMGEVHDKTMFIDDSPNLSMVEIRAKARRLKQKHDIRLLVVDYIQLMSSGRKVESRQQEVSEFSRQMKLMAKELDIPVVALSQLNRGPETRNDKRPMLADLRESGSLEQDADIVILIHREAMYDKDSPKHGEAELIVAKHRNGPTKDISVVFQGHRSRFLNLADPV